MTENQLNRMKLSDVCSLEAYNWLLDLINDQQKNQRYVFKIKDYFYHNISHRMYLSKFLESVVTSVLRARGGDPIKAADAGKYIDKSKTVTDIVGNKRTIGSGDWVKQANVRPGRADIVCYFDGALGRGLYNIEVKIKGDRLSDDQKTEMMRAINNGEFYCIIKTIDDFIKLLNK